MRPGRRGALGTLNSPRPVNHPTLSGSLEGDLSQYSKVRRNASGPPPLVPGCPSNCESLAVSTLGLKLRLNTVPDVDERYIQASGASYLSLSNAIASSTVLLPVNRNTSPMPIPASGTSHTVAWRSM